MIPVGESYRSPVGFEARSALAALILGLVAATLSAALIWLWEISPVPTLVIITSMLQGAILGGLLAFVIHRLKIHTRWLAFGIGLLSGLLSLALIHAAHYLLFVFWTIPREIAGEPELKPEQKQVLLALHHAAPIRFTDQFLQRQTGHAGFVGFMLLRAEAGEQLERHTISGPMLWGLWAFEGLFVVLVSAALAMGTASRPFCEDCRSWCEKHTGLPTFPGPLAEPLAAAVRADNLAEVRELRKHRLLVADGDAANLVLHACPRCELGFLDLNRAVGSGNQTRVVPLLKHVRLSPAMSESLRGPSRVPEATPEAEPSDA